MNDYTYIYMHHKTTPEENPTCILLTTTISALAARNSQAGYYTFLLIFATFHICTHSQYNKSISHTCPRGLRHNLETYSQNGACTSST